MIKNRSRSIACPEWFIPLFCLRLGLVVLAVG
jgi:hypothetical protein